MNVSLSAISSSDLGQITGGDSSRALAVRKLLADFSGTPVEMLRRTRFYRVGASGFRAYGSFARKDQSLGALSGRFSATWDAVSRTAQNLTIWR